MRKYFRGDFRNTIFFQTSKKNKISKFTTNFRKKRLYYNSIVVSGTFLGISIRSLSLQSTTPLKHVHGYGHTGTLHV
jgi:hypothetical protein